MDIHQVLAHLLSGRSLTSDQSQALFERLLTGQLDDAQIAAVLSLIQSRKPTVDEVIGAARVMRAHVTPVSLPEMSDTPACGEISKTVVIDTCGTGGAPKTFNISTAAAIVVAACDCSPTRVLVAKHGNRSRTGRGSAEILMALGVNVDASPDIQTRCLRQAGVCFCFAIHHHPAMKYAIGPRRSLGFPTIFNILGPLTNPANTDRQLIGVYSPELVDLVAQALAGLGARRAIVAHGLDGLDELTTTGPTMLAHIDGGVVAQEEITPAQLGFKRATLEQLKAETVDEAAAIIKSILAGESSPHRDIVLLNAAAGLIVAGVDDAFEDALQRAAQAIDSGKAQATLAALATCSTAK